jgi:hypothetical protein
MKEILPQATDTEPFRLNRSVRRQKRRACRNDRCVKLWYPYADWILQIKREKYIPKFQRKFFFSFSFFNYINK